MVAVLLGLVPPWLAAYSIIRWAWPQPPSPWRALLRGALATGLTPGLSSLAFFLWAVLAGPQRPGLYLAEVVVFGAAALGFGWFTRPSPPAPKHLVSAQAPTGLRLVFTFVLLCAVGVAGWYLWHSPHGDWDAWAIWNLRARFLHRGGEHWTAAFSPRIPWSHPDYPLLLPAAVARSWGHAGSETTLVPGLIACLFGIATVGLLMSALALLRSPGQGYLGGMVLLATPFFVELTTAEYADVPLAFFFLAATALLEAHDHGGVTGLRLPFLAGALAALAAWTKNEGSLFLAATVFVRLLAAARRPGRAALRELAALALGALPVVLVLAYFKLRLAPVNDLVAGQQGSATRERLLDAGRYALIAWFFLLALLSVGPGAVVVLAVHRRLVGRPPRGPDRPRVPHAPAVVALMLAGYAFVYLTTPYDLAWHLSDSVHRLFMQLWPTALLAFFLATATPEEAGASAPPAPRL